jgi:hypothetical protein
MKDRQGIDTTSHSIGLRMQLGGAIEVPMSSVSAKDAT